MSTWAASHPLGSLESRTQKLTSVGVDAEKLEASYSFDITAAVAEDSVVIPQS